MVPQSVSQRAATATVNGPPLGPPKRSSTMPATIPTTGPGRSLLAPEDAIYQGSPPRRQSAAVNKLQKDLRMTSGGTVDARIPVRGRLQKGGHRSESRRRNRVWKKLLWVKQSCAFGRYLGHLVSRNLGEIAEANTSRRSR